MRLQHSILTKLHSKSPNSPKKSHEHTHTHTISPQGSNSLAESEGRGLHLCPVCVRKVTWVVGVDPVTRYYALLRHCERGGRALEAQAGWLMHRLKVLCVCVCVCSYTRMQWWL